MTGGELDQKVLYIGGFGRSGSTLVERILGQLPGFCSAGEIVFLWQRGLIDGQLCGCGVPVPECEFWSRVGKTAFGGWDQIDAHEMLAPIYSWFTEGFDTADIRDAKALLGELG